MHPFSRCALLACFVAIATPKLHLASQAAPRNSAVLKGVVVDQTGLPIEGAQVSIESARTESNEKGEFIMTSRVVGEQRLRVRRVGFRPDSQDVVTDFGRTLQVNVVLKPVAVTLAVVTVTGRHDFSGAMAGFYRRRAAGSGRYFTREDIEKRNPAKLSDLLRGVAGISVTPQRTSVGSVRVRGSRCAPVVFLDGHGLTAGEFDLDSVDPRSFDGIEIYSGGATVPAEFQRTFRMSSSCGTILLWSKRGEPRARAAKATALTPAALIAKMIEDRTVFTAGDVDSVARVDSAGLVIPMYPTSLYESAIPGRVLAEFVVGANGEVDMATFNVVTATDRAFVEAVRFALRDQRFIAASRGGKPVHQVMQLPFNFVPDSTAVRRRR
jgi:hypothetical protein